MADDEQVPGKVSHQTQERTARDVADAYVDALTDLDPLLATRLGVRRGEDRLPDLSPAGQRAADDLAMSALADLDALRPDGGGGAVDRRCARLLRERLAAGLAVSAQGEHLAAVSNLFGPPQRVRDIFLDMPSRSDEDWSAIARRMSRVREALAGYRQTLAEGLDRGMIAGPMVSQTVVGQLAEWEAAADGRGWFADFAAAAPVPAALRADLDRAAADAIAAVADLRRWLETEYLPRSARVPDGVGADRYRTSARRWTGADLDPQEAYEWGWSQYQSLRSEMAAEAGRVLPGASALRAMNYLNEHGEAIDGVEEIRLWLQRLMDQVIADLDGTHFDLADRIKRVEARIAPPGSAAAPHYTPPSQDFTRPGRTWLPTLGRTRFPLWNLISTWYHEGVPGHHLQLAQWRHLSERLSIYQTSVGGVSACSEGWALYAERLMDELGYLEMPGARLGYLDAQMMRAIRVVIDIGMHLRLRVPADSPIGAGQAWTPQLAREFFGAHSGRPGEVLRGGCVVRRGRAARRGDPRLHGPDRIGQVEVGAVQVGDHLVHQILQPEPDLLHPLDGLAVGVQMGHRGQRGGSRQHLLRFGVHLRTQFPVLGPAPVECLARIEAGAGPPARAGAVAVSAHPVRDLRAAR